MINEQGARSFARYFETLVHESARGSALTRARHQSFIASHIVGGFSALCLFPVYLSFVGQPDVIAALAFAWFLTPIGIAIFLARTGLLAAAHLLSALNLAGLVTGAMIFTGGTSSFLLAWMIVVPLEAALSSDRRVVLCAVLLACAALVGIHLGGEFGWLPPPHGFPFSMSALLLLGTLSALIYAGGLAVTIQRLHQQSEELIETSEQRYRLLAENATDLITRHNQRGKVTFASLASEGLFACSPSRLMGDGLLNRVLVADRPAYLSALSRSLETGQPVSAEFRVHAASGSEQSSERGTVRFIEMRCRPLKSAHVAGAEVRGCPGEVVAVSRDITERKVQEAELLRTRDDAEQASRAKTQFLANVSHELRTPLNAIIGFSEILKGDLFSKIDVAQQRDYARLIHESGEHLLQVVNDILDMSKIEAGRYEISLQHFSVQNLVDSCAELMRHGAAQKSIGLETVFPAELPEIHADRMACKQMMLNLLSNAIKFTDSGGRIIAGAELNEDVFSIYVEDNGIGIAKEDLKRVGTPFTQVHASYARNHDGTGLGLSVVKGLAQLHGGSMSIESELGAGTRVTLRLPLDPEMHGVAHRPADGYEPQGGEVVLLHGNARAG